jgi:hypothetical protein
VSAYDSQRNVNALDATELLNIQSLFLFIAMESPYSEEELMYLREA